MIEAIYKPLMIQLSMRSSKKALVGILCIVALTFVFSATAQASTFNASGIVTDANGNPVQNATVSLVNNNYKLVAQVQTDLNGSYEFTNIDSGTALCKVLTTYTDSNGKTYTVPPEYSNWFSANGMVMINKTYTQITDYAPAAFSAMGQVTDKSGNPVEGARVMLIDDNNKEAAATRSDSNGNFEFANLAPTTKNFTISVLYINGTQSYKTAQSPACPQSGTVFVDKNYTTLTDYSPSAVSPQTTVMTAPASTAIAEKPVNVNALAVALLLSILILAGAYLLLKKAL